MKTKALSGDIPGTPTRFIFFALKPYRKWLLLLVVFMFLGQLFSDSISFVIRGLVDSATAFTAGEGALRTTFFWAMLYPVLLFLTVASYRVIGFALNYITVHARTGTTKKLFEYLSLHSLSYFSDRFSGALSNKVSTVSNNMSRLIGQFVWSILSLFFSTIVTFVLIATSSLMLAFVFVGGFFILIPINIQITKKQIVLSEKMAETAAKLRGQVIDVISNITAVQQYAQRKHEIARLDETIKEHREADITSDNYREKVLLINNVLVVIFIGGIIYWAFSTWSSGGISLGEFVMIATLISSFMYSLTHIGQNLNNIMESYGEIKNGLKEIIVPHDITDAVGAKRLEVKKGTIAFANVSFAYEENTGDVLKNLFLEIQDGEKVGVVGTSGAGKTTLVKLLLRQHDVSLGSITIDNQDIKDVTQESLRDNISVVPQEPLLFHRTIRENIMYGKLDATEEEMVRVAKKAQIHDFITSLPDGYESLVGERGIKLSVGQRQRIAIARAFLKNAPILILDEATSALDSESEVAVQKALHNLMEGKTVIAIAHRLSTLREMDRILVFKDGEIVEDGTHNTLVKKKKGFYASLWNHQAGGFLDENV